MDKNIEQTPNKEVDLAEKIESNIYGDVTIAKMITIVMNEAYKNNKIQVFHKKKKGKLVLIKFEGIDSENYKDIETPDILLKRDDKGKSIIEFDPSVDLESYRKKYSPIHQTGSNSTRYEAQPA